MSSPGAALEVNGVSRSFGALSAVDAVTMSIRPGEMRGLIGPNGAGKTTFFNVVTGFLRPTSGTVVLAGEDVTGASPQRIANAGMTRTFQATKAISELSCLENVAIGRHRSGRTGAWGACLRTRKALRESREAIERAGELLDWLGVAELGGRYPNELTAGQLRLLEVARALAGDPSVLLLDEPAAGLSQAETETLATCLAQLKSSGLTCVLVEHDVDLVLYMCDRITVLNFGKVIAEGTPSEMARDQAVIDAYLGTRGHIENEVL